MKRHRATLVLATALTAPGQATTIMPMGDSITRGFAEPGGSYRLTMSQADPTIDFVGDLAGGCCGFDNDHQAIGGYRIEQMTAEFGPAVAAHQPETVLLLAGTNNHWTGATAADYHALIQMIRTNAPAARIIAATVPRFGTDREPATAYWTDEWVENRNSVVLPAINAALAEAISQTPNAQLVDYFAALDPTTDLTPDAVHPNTAGQAKLAALFTAELHRTPGDLDGDGDIDGTDLSAAMSSFSGPNATGLQASEGNLDGDGDIDGVDLSAMFAAFTGPAPAVPGPAGAALLLLAARRRR